MQGRTRHVGARIACEEEAGVGDLLSVAEAAERDLGEERGLVLFGKTGRHVRVDEARSDAVDRDAARADLAGEGLGHAHEARLGGGIVDLAGVAHGAHDGRDGDDAAGALLHHRAHAGAGKTEGGGEVGLDDVVPGVVLHAHHERVAGDASVVDENVDAAEFGDRVDHGLGGGLTVADVEHDAAALAAEFGDAGRDAFGAGFARGRADHGGAGLHEGFKNGSADASARAGHERDAALERIGGKRRHMSFSKYQFSFSSTAASEAASKML